MGFFDESRRVPADMSASVFRLGRGPHLLPDLSLPGKSTWIFREEVPKVNRLFVFGGVVSKTNLCVWGGGGGCVVAWVGVEVPR